MTSRQAILNKVRSLGGTSDAVATKMNRALAASRPMPTMVFAVVGRGVAGLVVIGALLFLPAGTWQYWQAWCYLATIFVPVLLIGGYLLKRDPALLERRLQMHETERGQRAIIASAAVLMTCGFVLPGLDRRFGWSRVPSALVAASDALLLAGFVLYFWVLRTNTYAKRTIDVERGQRVISSGPYAVVRHPMYLAMSVFFLATPTALGSVWMLLPMLPLPFVLALRIGGEEKLLRKELEGYAEYCRKVPFRLLPGLW